MNKLFIWMLTLLTTASCTNQQEPFPAIRQLMERTIGEQANRFIIDSIGAENQKDVFELEPVGTKIRIAASSPSAAAAGFNYYLKNQARCLITQSGQKIQLPDPLPSVEQKVRIVTPFTWRYFLNYCTFNYSMGGWSWDEWEQELDWMALNGINMPLAITGTEAVWQNTLIQFNFTDDEAREFIVGPAYTAWWLMGNIERWGGPVSQEWINQRVQLQKKIIQRMRELGMTPVFQGFYSMVPTKLKEKFPIHRIYPGGNWAYFERPATLDPTDSLFAEMAKVYYREMEKLYGTTLFYGGDPFHEGGNTENIDLTQSAKKIQQAMQKAVPGSIWVLQGWWENPSDKLLEGIDPEKALILDLFAEGRPNWSRRDCYTNTPWIWSMLQNFGNKTGMFGRLEMVCSEPFRALQSEKGARMVGIGSMPEGTDNNPVMFDALFDMVWRTEAPNVDEWLKNYTHYRYGQLDEQALEAWAILKKTVYRGPVNQEGTTDAIICARPSLDGTRSWNWGNTAIYYDTLELQKAWKILLEAAPNLKTSDAYQYDLVDLTRQVLTNRSQIVHREMVQAFQNHDEVLFAKKSDEFLTLIADLDRLLATRKEFLLGNWIKGFTQMATSMEEKKLFEQNARMLITVWGNEQGAKELHDYAMKQWSGLLLDFYYKRWELYFEVLRNRLESQQIDDPDFYLWEQEWVKQEKNYDTLPIGNSLKVCRQLFEHYFNPLANKLLQTDSIPLLQTPTLEFILKTLSYYNINNYSLNPSEIATSKIKERTVETDQKIRIHLYLETKNEPKHAGTIELNYQWSFYEWTLISIKNIDFKQIAL
ncbi:MAG TPA: alpha-N-acetylglucosaminidase [Marinilabiliales bacterium]|nr:alpha-N-acetylglucosaminidase [Marinilabiliales bacterium]